LIFLIFYFNFSKTLRKLPVTT